MTSITRFLVGCLVAILLSQVGASAGDRFDDEARRYLQRAVSEFAAGWLRDSTRNGKLNDGQSETIPFYLSRGEHFRFVGACDSDCDDLDLRLYDENWHLVDDDAESDDTPVVDVTPIRSATFHLRVSMASCASEPCAYAVAKMSDR